MVDGVEELMKMKRQSTDQFFNFVLMLDELEDRDHVNDNQMIVYNPNISLFKFKKKSFYNKL